ncbi:MAG: glycosyltransferase, partial [Actinomycetota bacterium]|nr:glycosyltransferase [Actinomycetota bacterium]
HIAIQAMAQWEGKDRPYLALAGGSIYGDDSSGYEQELRTLITSCGLEEDVALLGGVADVASVYASADLIVQPAIYPEGFGRVVVEAQLAGIPVIATDIGGARELIDHGESGLLVPVGDSTALRTAIERVLTDQHLKHMLISSGQESGRRFSANRHVDAIETIYQDVLSR